jgi:hypothetical protein
MSSRERSLRTDTPRRIGTGQGSESSASDDVSRRGWARKGPVNRRPDDLAREDLAPLRNLTRTRPGEVVQVEGIAFRSVEDHCRGLGIHPGSRLLRRRAREEGLVGLEDADGRRFSLTRDFALFVWVKSLESG